ncbi:MAG: N-acetylmuramoyl-L-alanine amidase [Anaerolineae bacterium]|nr:N-acetylmuramoyl-L-alanine amidase [Anaerolineae bacterium]
MIHLTSMGVLAVRKDVLQRLERLAFALFLLALAGSLLLVWKGNLDARVSRMIDPYPPFTPIPGLEGRKVGLIAGHTGSDSGAVCPDGLREVDVNHAIAVRLAERLRQAGLQVDVLGEFDDRLPGYRADALLSIHADSCIDATGFKVARASFSIIPDADDRLVACLYRMYGETTGLPRHQSSITHDMTQYHAFRVIDPRTPAAIIETGFLGGDRRLLTKEQDRVVYGLARGIICFLKGEQP